MSSVFVSYARQDRPIADALAQRLSARNIEVWWDAELLATQDFTDAIETALRNSVAVIVIWSPRSARSKFVRDEARLALHLDKLVATKVAELATVDLPLGFGGQHTVDVLDVDAIDKALAELGVGNIAAGAMPERRASEISSTPNEQSTRRTAALEKPTVIAADDTAPRRIRMHNFTAFLRGLTLRIPEFQFESNGIYTAWGAVLAYFALATVFFIGADVIFKNLGIKDYDLRWFGPMTLCMIAFAVHAGRHMTAWFKQRNFVAAWIFSIPTGIFAFLAVGVAHIALARETPSDAITFSTMAIVAVSLLGRIWFLHRSNR